MPLYYASNKYEYMPCPNQSGIRFGNHYRYNSYSQRSDEPDSTKLHVLGLGDSVLYGGTQTDQDSLATSLFTKDTGIQMLNISAGSWGPDNCAAYLKEYGLFNHNITSLNAKDLSMTNRYNSQIKAIPIFLQIYVRG